MGRPPPPVPIKRRSVGLPEPWWGLVDQVFHGEPTQTQNEAVVLLMREALQARGLLPSAEPKAKADRKTAPKPAAKHKPQR